MMDLEESDFCFPLPQTKTKRRSVRSSVPSFAATSKIIPGFVLDAAVTREVALETVTSPEQEAA